MQVIPTIISIIALLLEFRVPRCYLIVGKWVRGTLNSRSKKRDGLFILVVEEHAWEVGWTGRWTKRSHSGFSEHLHRAPLWIR